jgi:hypothetical protein
MTRVAPHPVLVLALLLAAAPAHADAGLDWLGPARRIPRTWSASRDTPAMSLGILPRDIRTAGAELAMATWTGDTVSVRTGFAGLIELESNGETESFANLFPHGSGTILWRGSYAYYGAVAFDALAARWCATCALEVAAQYRHESQHYTGGNSGGEGMDVSAQPYVGDDVIVDVAARRDVGQWRFAARATGMVFIPGRSSYAGGPGIDLHARLRTRWLDPFVSVYGEYLVGTELRGRRWDDAYLVRVLAGVALPSALGDVMVYVAADAGNRKGIRGLTEEATLGAGVRLALGGP